MTIVLWTAIFCGSIFVWMTRWRTAGAICLSFGYLLGLGTGNLHPLSLLSLLPLSACGLAFHRKLSLWPQVLAHFLFIATALALTLHLFPGFHNQLALPAQRFTPDAAAFVLYLNLDKPLVGFFLLLALPSLLGMDQSFRQWKTRALLIFGCTVACCLGLAKELQFLHWNPKLPQLGWLWAVNNLALVVPAEEALFRGYVQGGLTKALQRFPFAPYISLGIASVVFGCAHYAGGWQWIVLASIAGIGYGTAYRGGGLRASILVHFSLNLTHFLLFTYPMLQK